MAAQPFGIDQVSSYKLTMTVKSIILLCLVFLLLYNNYINTAMNEENVFFIC